MMSALDTGVLRYKEDGKWIPLVVLGGFASVDSNQLSVLVNDFEEADQIDMKEAQKKLDDATSMLEKAASKKDKLEATAKAWLWLSILTTKFYRRRTFFCLIFSPLISFAGFVDCLII